LHVHHLEVELQIAWLIVWRERHNFVSNYCLDDEVCRPALVGVIFSE